MATVGLNGIRSGSAGSANTSGSSGFTRRQFEARSTLSGVAIFWMTKFLLMLGGADEMNIPCELAIAVKVHTSVPIKPKPASTGRQGLVQR